MSKITKSLSEVLRSIKSHIPIDIELFSFPNSDVGCALSIADIKVSNRTTDYLTVKTNILIECQVSTAIADHNLKAIEVAAMVLAKIDGQSFNCSVKPPENAIAVPYGEDERFTSWVVSFDLECWVEKIDVI